MLLIVGNNKSECIVRNVFYVNIRNLAYCTERDPPHMVLILY